MISDQIFTALGSLVAGRVYAVQAGDSPVTPYIVYTRVADVPQNTLANGPSISNTRMQIDIYDPGYRACQILADQVKAAMLAAFPQCVVLLEQDMYDTPTKLYRVLNDFSIWQ